MAPALATADASLAWVQKDLSVQAYEGTSNRQSLELSFSGDATAPGATINGNLRGVASVDLTTAATMGDGHATVTLTINLPSQAEDSYVGNIQLTDKGKPLQQPLHIAVATQRWDSQNIPSEPTTPSPDRVSIVEGTPVVNDQLTVAVAEGVADPAAVIRDIASTYGAQITGAVPELGIYDLRLPGATGDVVDAVRTALRNRSDVAGAAYSYLANQQSYTNDPVWSPSPSSHPDMTWNLTQIDAPSAWDDSTGEAVNVGVIDGGFYPQHIDLSRNIARVSTPTKVEAHGTHVSGSACADGNNGNGSVGVAWRCKLNLQSVRTMDYQYGNFNSELSVISSILASMREIAQSTPKPRVVNMSVGMQLSFDCTRNSLTTKQSQMLEDFDFFGLLMRMTAQKNPSILWVIAAANEGKPARCSAFGGLGTDQGLPNVVTVAASTRAATQASYSAYGDGITVAAPGGESGAGVFSTNAPSCNTLIRGCAGAGYYYSQGTSMAAPHVTGTAALAFAANPALTAGNVKKCLIDGAVAGGKKIPGQSYSIINAKKTVDCALGRLSTSSIPVTAFSTNAKSAFAQRADGSVWAWGDNTSGQLGIGTDLVTNSLPTPIPGLTGAKSISTGLATTFALMNDGTVRAWGDNSHGLLGNGTTNNANLPQPVPGLSGVRSIVINESDTPSMGFGYSPGLPGDTVFAVMNDGRVMAWGENPSGVLGNGSMDRSLVPTQVQNLAGAVDVTSQGGTAWALKNDGTVWAWGDNSEGQLGIGEPSHAKALKAQPVAIDNVTKIQSGLHALVALKADGTVWAWGTASYGLVEGNGIQPAPVQRSGLSDISKISVTRNTGVAVRKDGTAWGWGWNGGGEAGVGIRGSYSGGTWANNIVQPAQMPNISNVRDVRVGMALTADGTSWQWAGQIFGVAPMYDPEPTQSVGGVASILPVQSTRWVIKSDGTLWGWGQSSQLFTQYAQYVPGKVLG
ncbi:S8 family serine peptidase [Arthrobacter sp. MAHUQ-56]